MGERNFKVVLLGEGMGIRPEPALFSSGGFICRGSHLGVLVYFNFICGCLFYILFNFFFLIPVRIRRQDFAGHAVLREPVQ